MPTDAAKMRSSRAAAMPTTAAAALERGALLVGARLGDEVAGDLGQCGNGEDD